MRRFATTLGALMLVATVGMIAPAGVAAREPVVTLKGTTTRSTTYGMVVFYTPRQSVWVSTDYRVPKGKGGTCTVKVVHYQQGRPLKALYRVTTSSHAWQFKAREQVWGTSAVFPRRSVPMTFKVVVAKGSHCEYRAWVMQPHRA